MLNFWYLSIRNFKVLRNVKQVICYNETNHQRRTFSLISFCFGLASVVGLCHIAFLSFVTKKGKRNPKLNMAVLLFFR